MSSPALAVTNTADGLHDDVIAQVVTLPRAMPTVLGMGAHLKASLCLFQGHHAYVTHSAGDMETLEAVERYQVMRDAMLDRVGGISQLEGTAHDLHPDFHTTVFAGELNCTTLAVQHHHAHILATALEHQFEGPVIGLALDGFGLGLGDESWGGELLRVDGLAFERLGHLSRLAQPGGDIAAREPWRMAAAALHALGRGDEIHNRFADQPHGALLQQMLDKKLNSPETSSCGRLFDAACGLLGVRPVAAFEGQAPMELEALVTEPVVLGGAWTIERGGVLDITALLAAIAEMSAADGANAFHGTLAAAMADWVMRACERQNARTIAFGGGCFLNRVLTDRLSTALRQSGCDVLTPTALSPGDAGLSFGQAYAAALSAEKRE